MDLSPLQWTWAISQEIYFLARDWVGAKYQITNLRQLKQECYHVSLTQTDAIARS